MRFIITFMCLLYTSAAASEEIVLGLSKNEVAITANFDGSDISIVGAVKRDAPALGGKLGVIVTVAGPDIETTVRRKERKLGVWVNSDQVKIQKAPSFYAVLSSAPLDEILGGVENLQDNISLERAIRAIETNVIDSRNFSNALIRIRQNEGLYQQQADGVYLQEDTLFQAVVTLPANLTEGDYKARIMLTRDGKIVDDYETVIPVKKVGIGRWLYNLAHLNPYMYGFMSLAIAIFAGWFASAVFTLIRR